MFIWDLVGVFIVWGGLDFLFCDYVVSGWFWNVGEWLIYFLVFFDGLYDGNKGFVYVYLLFGRCFDILGIEFFS